KSIQNNIYISHILDIKKEEKFVFFFSSRRRHTSSKRDWSSDVCSSDLVLLTELGQSLLEANMKGVDAGQVLSLVLVDDGFLLIRSEERRVGKECRYLRKQ